MTERIATTFATADAEQRAALVAYVTYGDPSQQVSDDVLLAIAAAGADIIELGVPFSDPSADGPVIAAAMERASANGVGLPATLEAVARFRTRNTTTPIVLFGYYNPIMVYGVERFCDQCQAVGVDAVLTVDLPVNELAELATPLAQRGVGVVPLLAPTSTADRFALAGQFSPPFIYYISMTGVTGGNVAASTHDERSARVRAIAGQTQRRVGVGFGIRTRNDAAQVAAYADAVIVGSALVTAIANASSAEIAVSNATSLIGDLRAGLSRS